MSLQNSTDDVSDGDLGLGDGLKPGGLPVIPDFDKEFNGKSPHENKLAVGSKHSFADLSSHSGFTTPEDSEDEFEVSLMPIASIQRLKSDYSHLNTPSTRRSKETMPLAIKDDEHFYDERYIEGTKNPNGRSSCDANNVHSANFPVYADVPYGTSIRQQKELFKHNIEGLRKKSGGVSGSTSSDGSSKDQTSKVPHKKKRTSEEIAMKLAKTLQEVEDLKTELETCEQRLDSKYQAIDILRVQAQDAQADQRIKDKMIKETTKKLAQVQVDGAGGGSKVVSLGNEKDLTDLSPNFSLTPIPARSRSAATVSMEKYKRICQDNRALMEALEARTEELRKVKAKKMAADRENDELLALLDIQERARYSLTRSTSSEENYCNYTSTELAVLGACRCRISKPDPCGCATAAANLKRDTVKLKEQLQQYKSRRDEAFLTVDAYRKAFEEQLQRNKCLTLQFSNLSCNSTNSPSRQSRTRKALKWLIGSLNDEEMSDDNCNSTPGPSMSDSEIITYLTEMLQEKKEVLAHQKLASQILADRVRVLEERLSHTEEEEEEENGSSVFSHG